MSFREIGKHYQPILGTPSVKCYKCGDTIPLRNAPPARPYIDDVGILHKQYVCHECKNKLRKEKIIEEE